MQCSNGSQEPQDERLHPLEERVQSRRRGPGARIPDDVSKGSAAAEAARRAGRIGLTTEERDRIADGEPYCFRCGKPASSFGAYCDDDGECGGPPYEDAVTYVREDEGTYNEETNRFACDECYIAIGQPSTRRGWVAP